MAWPQFHSIYGRLFGVDYDGYPVAQKGFRDNVTALTSASTGTALKHYGVNTLTVSTGSSASGSGAGFTMEGPVAGVPVTIANVTTASTQAISVVLSSAYFMTGAFAAANVTAGSSYGTLTLNTKGETVELVGLSSVYYLVRNLNGFSTGDTPFSA